MKTWLYIINNFAHDLFTGLWFGSFIGLYTVHAKLLQAPLPGDAATALVADLEQVFFRLGALALFCVMLTGVVRFFYRREWDNMENLSQAKKPILIIKHALLGTAFLLGSFLACKWVL